MNLLLFVGSLDLSGVEMADLVAVDTQIWLEAILLSASNVNGSVAVSRQTCRHCRHQHAILTERRTAAVTLLVSAVICKVIVPHSLE